MTGAEPLVAAADEQLDARERQHAAQHFLVAVPAQPEMIAVAQHVEVSSAAQLGQRRGRRGGEAGAANVV